MFRGPVSSSGRMGVAAPWAHGRFTLYLLMTTHSLMKGGFMLYDPEDLAFSVPISCLLYRGFTPVKHSILNVKALEGAFNQEKALEGAFFVIVKTL